MVVKVYCCDWCDKKLLKAVAVKGGGSVVRCPECKKKEGPPGHEQDTTIEIVAAAIRFAAKKRAEGWTKQDFAAALKKMFESDTV